jgi:transcriptional regulator with XRE-family HTH domain
MKKIAKSDSNAIRPEDKFIGGLLATARNAANLTQEEVAIRAGWYKDDGETPHQQRVSHYETGRRRITVIDLMQYAKAIQVAPGDIIGIKRIPVLPKE